MELVRRVSVVGNSGSGKSVLARRIAATLDVPYMELDSIHHRPGWTPIDPAAFVESVRELTTGDGWVIDGNYRTVVSDGPVWQRADTVVWLDLPRPVVMRRVIGRSVRRVATREELWNGNRERLRTLWTWDPSQSIIRWSWTQHEVYRERYRAAIASPAWHHLRFVRLTSPKQVDRWFDALVQERGTRAWRR